MLYNKWWKKDADTNQLCPKVNTDPSKASALNVVNIGGVFVVLLCGLSFAILVAIGEFCWRFWGENKMHPATSKLGIKSSTKEMLYSAICLVIRDRESGKTVKGTECQSCENLRNAGHGIKYI